MPTEGTPIKYLSIKDIQNSTGLTRDPIVRAISLGYLKAHRPKGSRRILIAPRDFERWMNPTVTPITANLGGDAA
ncbi:hypothetical protein [Propionibacterium freudenreichii]|uniref:hypothetical protein n=1 Tax=Propionibacterium freudenreichii TaxID=1744 RepID=UPI001107F5B4|nr:hypothetical protein [Propionibacterium freudenreichii]MDK9351162.1 hypothetical protein [Propionibacterium freudenreichii]